MDDSRSRSEKLVPAEICRKWSALVYKVYERMIHSSEVSFFLSAPQLISTLGFLLGACNLQETQGLLFSYDNGDGNTEIDYLIDHTLKFVHNWSSEIRSLLAPGRYHRSRRIYTHPKFVNPHNENTFQYFRMFRVEEKIFENYDEVREWASQTLKADFAKTQKILNMWECHLNQLERLEHRKYAAMGKSLSAKVRSTSNNKGKLDLMASWKPPPKTDVGDVEKKPPILVWTSHAIVEMPGEMFDGEHVYTWAGNEYLKVHESPVRKIRVISGDHNFHTVLLPTQNRQLTMIVCYGFNDQLCSIEKMTSLIAATRPAAPCIVRKNGDKNLEAKKSIYLPYWKTKDFPASRIAQHLVATMDLRSLFVVGGFGDLAVADAIPSSTGDPKKVSHLQHFGLVTIRNSPEKDELPEEPISKSKRKSKKKSKKDEQTPKTRLVPLNEPDANKIEMIPYPICVILWDGDRELPAYMGKITGEMTEQEIEELQLAEKSKKQKRSCCR